MSAETIHQLPSNCELAQGVRVMVVTDHELLQWGLRFLFGRQDWVDRCIPAETRAQAAERGRRYEPHVALVDVMVSGHAGTDITRELLAVCPSTRVVFLSGAGEISERAARVAGAWGTLPRAYRASEAAGAVWQVASGKTSFSPASNAASPELPQLTSREREILTLIAAGHTNREIAGVVFLSPNTVKEYSSSLYRKLRVRNRTAAVRRAAHLGLIESDDASRSYQVPPTGEPHA